MVRIGPNTSYNKIRKKSTAELGDIPLINPAFGRLKQEDHKFEGSLRYTDDIYMRPQWRQGGGHIDSQFYRQNCSYWLENTKKN